MTSPQPYPALPIVAEHTYLITYTVAAATELAAIDRAVGMLRADVRLIAVHEVHRATPVLWRVSLKVWEAA